MTYETDSGTGAGRTAVPERRADNAPGKVYQKASSIVELRGGDFDQVAALERIRRFAADLPGLSLPAYRRTILERACAALLAPEPASCGEKPEAGGDGFFLRPHVVNELAHLGDAELPRYLFYRYRYETFPLSRTVDAYPPCVQIEPTSICNYRCVFCYQTDRGLTQARHGHMGMMSLDLFRQVVDQIEGEVEAVTLASRGEPLMAREIVPMLQYIGGKFLGLKVNTNASFLDEEKAHALLQAEPNTVVFSVDAADPELYAQLRVNGKFDAVLRNIERFCEIRSRHYPGSRTILRVSGVRFSTRQDIEANDAFWNRYVDQVALTDYIPWENAYEMEPNDHAEPCSDLWRRMFVWWDGRINPCDVDYKSTLCVGTAPGTSISEAWTGEAYGRMREQHLSGRRGDLVPCRSCSLS